MRVFLGGTCSNSSWREKLIPLLTVNYFNPVVKDWTPECQKEELRQREECLFCLYVITPRMTGVYSIAEVIDDSNKKPEGTIFCVLDSDGFNGGQLYEFSKAQTLSLEAVGAMVVKNGGKYFTDLTSVATYLNTVSKDIEDHTERILDRGYL